METPREKAVAFTAPAEAHPTTPLQERPPEPTPADSQPIVLNGIDGVTGHYLVPPLDLGAVAAIATDRKVPDPARDRSASEYLERIWTIVSQPTFGLPYDVHAEVVEEAGWGIVFHQNEDAAVREALQPLMEHRRRQVGDARYKELVYRDHDDWASWLARYDAAPGDVNPECVPYYLLVIGSPERIPFGFGYQLDIEYAVGRLQFEDANEYRRYAESVVAYETRPDVPTAREVVYFATRHEFDRATQLSADYLVNPLAEGLPAGSGTPGIPAAAARAGFTSRKVWGEEASKEALHGILTATQAPPALLFTATHGMGWPLGHPEQRVSQGALLCQDWPGFGQVGSDHYFAASDLVPEARVHGMLAFLFACYGGGTPSHDRFFHRPGQRPQQIAPAPFIAALPRALLTHPNGGALACIAHVERAWGYSIMPPRTGPQLMPFRNAVGRLLRGEPVGHAMKDFNEKYAALGTRMSSVLEEVDFGTPYPELELSSIWIQRNDAEGYVVIGDPSVRLRVEAMQAA